MALWGHIQVKLLSSTVGRKLNHCVGLAFFFTACAALFVGTQVMFEHREDELRQGINMKC